MTFRNRIPLAVVLGTALSLALLVAPATAAPGATTDLAVLATPAIPDISLVDQNGKKIHFYSDLIQGKVVAVNFVFTTCSTICTPQGARFAELRKLLGDQAGRDVHLISVSIDPQSDTPAKLKAWSEKLGAGPGWTLVTGEKDEVVRLLKSLGAFDVDIKRHTPSLLLGNDRDKRWTRAYSLAPAAQLAGLLEGLRDGLRDKPPGLKTPPKEGK
ncbi:MAG: SCO family protein [Acidobacteriota bacterium]